MFIQMIQDRQQELSQVCAAHQVRQLYLFGSGATEEFDTNRSDLDFLVEFEPLTPRQHTDAYFSLRSALEKMFGRNIDLVETAGVRNKYVWASIERSRVPLYAAA